MDSKHCTGCEDNFYNGNNPHGIPRCWSLDTAELKLRKRVAVFESPPWNREPEELPSCYRQKDYVFVKPEVTK